ncbi:hypothetical protein B7P43_G15655 [Cryptotermes secundus]|uniref:Endonuclease-reverse transcriptase n=1 Tax=Cryptotermes secundus TaxID=105785 RepID=A0A2J7RQQ3_9NEOP|nr:hypothetical protein B7P43_G15655 [Cryptotermes secundus]
MRVTNQNLIQEEIKRRLNSGNACYHSVQNLLSSRLLSKSIKNRIYKTIILHVVPYGFETWSLTLREEHRLRVFENRLLRRIFGSKRDEVTGGWRKLQNEELLVLVLFSNWVVTIKLKRLQWAGHVQRMDKERIPKKILYSTIGGRRRAGKPRTRWIDAVEEDAKKLMGVRNWKRAAQEREEWRGLIREAKARHRTVAP